MMKLYKKYDRSAFSCTGFRVLLIAGLSFIASATFAQRVTNFVMYNSAGVTKEAKEATDFIVVKEYPDRHLVRLDYKMAGPLKKQRSYKDSAMKVLDGPYYEYAPDGSLVFSGNYENNQKEGRWYTFQNDSLIASALWSHDSLISVDDLNSKDSVISYPDEREAAFPGGLKAWRKYLVKQMTKVGEPTANGRTIVQFIVDKDGSIRNVHLRRSLNYLSDEQSLTAIQNAPKWKPAFQNGKNVRAYRLQPFTFTER